MFLTVFCTYAAVFFSVIMGAMALGQAGPSAQAIFSARAAAYDVFAVIHRASLIDPLSNDGKKLGKVQGRILIDNVSFAYPSRPEVKVCSNYSLTIEPGETVALVGPSGSGKSTVADGMEQLSVTSATSEDDTDVSLGRIWRMSAPEWKYLVFGGIGATMNAATFPVWGILFTKVTVLFFQVDKPRDDMLRDAMYWGLGFVGLGVVFGVSIMAQYYGFSVAAQRLVTRVRLAVYSSMLHQEIGWFDLDENTSGALVARLATDSATLQTMTSDMLNRGLVNVTTLVIGFGIAFYYSWEMTLVVLATTPIFIFTSYVQAQMMSGTNNSKENNDADNAAGTLLGEAIASIRTVASFSMEKNLNAAYIQFLEASKAADNKKGFAGGIAFGVSQGVMFFNLAFLFYLGGKWVADGRLGFESMFMVLNVIISCD
ncbi:hypothetical protein P43SY_001540 [Pythium insidiosum]|uniref:ABC transmembrane type-1 domain-containing protein n=1 Tax=Pythium insidiosum TaxID=114742 RepID=A0AAD5Q3N6_PYTIN|nr:hypothetical protein P43SY_001540 [Pythium insidiosum]